jgi:hypothetical protein
MFFNNKGSAMVAVVSVGIILNVVFVTVYFTVSHTQKVSGTKKIKTSVLSTAEAGKEKLYGEIAYKKFTPVENKRVTAYENYALKNSNFTVTCSSNMSKDTLYISSNGKENDKSSIIDVIARIAPDINLGFPPIRGAVTARSNITLKGNIEVDGREYDTNGVLIAGKMGVYGVSSCTQVLVDGSSAIGGSNVAPVGAKDTAGLWNSIGQNNAPLDTRFDSPEAFLGLAPGALDAYKTTTLPDPVKGLIYLTSDYVGPVHFSPGSSGILIVHNNSKTSQLHINEGVYKGIIICDQMTKVNGNADILGAVVTLVEGEVSTFGNGSATIHYSSAVLNKLAEYCSNVKKKVTELSWKERGR